MADDEGAHEDLLVHQDVLALIVSVVVVFAIFTAAMMILTS